tara:strand:- start:326 stop:589 length:264 start_codon:yes stop_codon:yes gene_type:complete
MGAGMDAETARQAAAIGVNVPGALTGACATTNMFRALSVNQTISASSAANAYLSAYSVNAAQRGVQEIDSINYYSFICLFYYLLWRR